MGKLEIQFSARGLPRMDLLSKSDPYLCVMMETGGGNYQVVAKTKHLDNNHDPDWPEVLEIEDESIRKDNDKLELRIEVE